MRIRFAVERIPVVLAASGHNLFGKLSYVGEAFRLPRQVRGSLGIVPIPKLALAAEGLWSEDDDASFGFGGEYLEPLSENYGVALRGGYNNLGRNHDLEKKIGLTLGGGVWFSDFTADYAWMPFGLFGQTHRFTLGFKF